MPQAVDEFLLWTIAEGGTPFGTRMLAFKDALSQDEIWQIMAYMRAGFPPPGAGGHKEPGRAWLRSIRAGEGKTCWGDVTDGARLPVRLC